MTVDTYVNKQGTMLGTRDMPWHEMLTFLTSTTSPLYPGRNLGTTLTLKGEINSSVWIAEIKSRALPHQITTYHASLIPSASDDLGADIVKLFCERWNDYLRPGAWDQTHSRIKGHHSKPHVGLRTFMSAFGVVSPLELDVFKVLLILCCGVEDESVRTFCFEKLSNEQIVDVARRAVANKTTFDVACHEHELFACVPK